MKLLTLSTLLACVLALPTHAAPGGSAKSIVLRTLQGENTGMDGMQISFLVRNLDGSVMPRDHKYPFLTSTRFKVKVTSTAEGNLTITNIDPIGRVLPLLTQPVAKGVETLIPERGDQFFEFEGPKGDERLKFEIVPASYNPPPPPLGDGRTGTNPNVNAIGGTISPVPSGNIPNSPYSNVTGKSIRLVTTSDGKSDFIIRPAGTGTLLQEIIVKHQ